MNDTHDEETEEEHAVRLRKISEEIKAEMKAGTFKFRKTVTGRFDYDSKIYPPVSDRGEFRRAVQELFEKHVINGPHITLDSMGFPMSMLSRRPIPRMVFFDECHHIKPEEYWLGYNTPKEKDWDRKTFKSGGSTAPSEEVRARLRAKRKAKRK